MTTTRCSQCGITDSGGHFGEGPYAGVFYCQSCWCQWGLIARVREGRRHLQEGMLLSLGEFKKLSDLFRLPKHHSEGWEPHQQPTLAELEELAMQAAVVHAGDLPIVDVKAPESPSDFNFKFPCVIRNATDGWSCLSWSLEETYELVGEERVPWRPCFGDWNHQPEVTASAGDSRTIAEYMTSKETRPGILFDQDNPKLGIHAALRGHYSIPLMLSAIHAHRIETKPVFSAGRRNTGVGFHAHPENWLAQLRGRKLWWIVPPGMPAADIEAPWQYLLLGRHPKNALFCILHPGEVLYLPQGWVHATWNLDDISLSLGCIGVSEGAGNPYLEIMKELPGNAGTVAEMLVLPTSTEFPSEWVAVD